MYRNEKQICTKISYKILYQKRTNSVLICRFIAKVRKTGIIADAPRRARIVFTSENIDAVPESVCMCEKRSKSTRYRS